MASTHLPSPGLTQTPTDPKVLSFETFLKEYSLEDPVLTEIAEITHDADLMDEKQVRAARV